MAYTPTQWQDGDIIDAEKLNKMEQGIADADTGNSHLGVGGEIELQASSWSNNTISVTISALGANDAVLLAPVSAEDKSALETANCIVSVENTTVTFTADKTPTSNISLNYFIVRGKA